MTGPCRGQQQHLRTGPDSVVLWGVVCAADCGTGSCVVTRAQHRLRQAWQKWAHVTCDMW
jgi:hypothetical protein